MADEAVGDEWVRRVLGIDLPIRHSAERGREAKAVNPRGIAYPAMLLRWRQAQNDAEDALGQIGQAYLALPNVQADPRYPEVQAVIKQLPALLPAFGNRLTDLLDQGINAGTDTGIAREALGLVGEYRQAIAGATTLAAFERFASKYVGALAVVDRLDGALAEIAHGLSAA